MGASQESPSQGRQPEPKTDRFDALVHAVVHDLRSPLVTIESMTGLLKESAAPRLQEDELVYLGHIENAAALMRGLLGDLSELNLIPPTVSSRVTVRMDELVPRLVEEMAAEIAMAKGSVAVAPGLPTVQGDPTVIEKVFRQLIDNGLKFRRPDNPPRIQIGCHTEGAVAEFRVEDNGIGVPPESRERIFGVFTKLHSRNRFPGNGIGLALVKRGVESHGGTVTLESVPGERTIVRFTLEPAALG